MFGKRGCFTLIELLVTIAVTVILAAMFIPALAPASERGRRARCISNMRRQGTAFAMYAIDNSDNYPSRDMYPRSAWHHRGSVSGRKIDSEPSLDYMWGHLIEDYIPGAYLDCPSNPITHTDASYGNADWDSYPVRIEDGWVMYADHSASGDSSWTVRYNYLAGMSRDGSEPLGREAYWEHEGDRGKYYPALTDEARGRRVVSGESFYPGGFNHPPFGTWARDIPYWRRPSALTEGGHFLYTDGSVSWSDADDWADGSGRGHRWMGLAGSDAEAFGAEWGYSDFFPQDITTGFQVD